MRFLVLSVSALCATCLGSTLAVAQTGPSGQAGDRNLPYSTHVDRRHGSDHVYPDRGAIIRDAPQGAAGVNYAGVTYRFAGGVWYQRLGPAYIVVAPPIGLVVPQLPAFATDFESAGKAYLYANDVFYSARPDLGGYEVVNDPEDQAPEQAQAPAGPAAPVVTPAVATAVEAPAAAPVPPPAQPASQLPVEPANDPAPADAPEAAASTPPGNPTAIAIQPRNGQSADQEASDRYECYRFAVAQSGFDPLATYGSSTTANVERHEYSRAQAACLEGRGYSLP
jgi:hypothetical protein